MTPDQDTLLARVFARLNEREHQVLSLTPEQLQTGLRPEQLSHHGTLHVRLADSHFLAALAGQSGNDGAVASVLTALAWGLQVHISLHSQLLGCLPLKALARMPVVFRDHQGRQIWLLTQALLSYRDIAQKHNGWLVVSNKMRLTPLAKETLVSHQLLLVRQE